jgi:hypothetical protein
MYKRSRGLARNARANSALAAWLAVSGALAGLVGAAWTFLLVTHQVAEGTGREAAVDALALANAVLELTGAGVLATLLLLAAALLWRRHPRGETWLLISACLCLIFDLVSAGGSPTTLVTAAVQASAVIAAIAVGPARRLLLRGPTERDEPRR